MNKLFRLTVFFLIIFVLNLFLTLINFHTDILMFNYKLISLSFYFDVQLVQLFIIQWPRNSTGLMPL